MWRIRPRGRGSQRVEWLHNQGSCLPQSMLLPDAVCIVDANVCVFVWVGQCAPEEDEALAMRLACRYGQTFEPALEVIPLFGEMVPPEFTSLFHGWLRPPNRSDAPDQRRDSLRRKAGLIGRVLRESAWPAATDVEAAGNAEEGVAARAFAAACAAALVVFTTSCGIARASRSRSRRACALLEHVGAQFILVDLATEPEHLPLLRRLLLANGLEHHHLRQSLPFVFLDGKLLSGGSKATLQELLDEGDLHKFLRIARRAPAQKTFKIR